MPCFHPIKAWKPPPGTLSRGRKALLFTDPHRDDCQEIALPCGQCLGCRYDRSKEWALRCVHEASLHESNCFLTLTYKDDPITLNVRDFQLFMKKLRKKVGKVRFFHCGEYGEQNGRPHHHALIFGWRPDDLEIQGRTLDGFIYRSPTLEKLWDHGFSCVGDVSFASAAYCARYILKKINGPLADEYYKGRKPEYITMSRRPGIGQNWFNQFSSDVYPKDFCTIESGRHVRPPRYYDKLFEKHHLCDLKAIKEKRLNYALSHPEEHTPERLDQKETVLRSKLGLLERKV